VTGSCEHGYEPSGAIQIYNLLISRATVSLQRTVFHRVMWVYGTDWQYFVDL